MQITTNQLEFVTIEGLLAYGELLARRPTREGVQRPALPPPLPNRAQLARTAMEQITPFLQSAQRGFSDAEAYRSARSAFIDQACAGDELVFYAAWNRLVAEGTLQPLLRAPIGSVLKPTHRR